MVLAPGPLMGARIVQCPNCAAEVEFKAGSSLLSVCSYCDTVVARIGGDIGELEVLGKVAPLTPPDSLLYVGRDGQWLERIFTIVGQVQYDHGAGPWSEWYVSFADGDWGWIAEAQGRIYLTLYRRTQRLPRLPEIVLGEPFVLDGKSLRAVAVNEARVVGIQGEVPFRAVPDDRVSYVDIEGPDGLFGTINYDNDEPTAFFLGYELGFSELFTADDVGQSYTRAASTVSSSSIGVGMNCPNCGAGVELLRPDESLRVTCGSCGALLDCSRGNELHLLASSAGWAPEGRLALGSQGKLAGVRWTVYGMLTKSVRVDGQTYRWQEYLLFQKQGGWRWLVESDGHWTLYAPLSAGDVTGHIGGASVRVKGGVYHKFSSSSARVEGLRGEFYWKVAVGDRVSATEYIKPPQVLSVERTSKELNLSLGEYIPVNDVQMAFALSDVPPSPKYTAPHQPNPYMKALYPVAKGAMWATALLLVMSLVRAVSSDHQAVVDMIVSYDAVSPNPSRQGRLVPGQSTATASFELDAQSNLAVMAQGWIPAGVLYLDGVLSEITTMRSRSFGVVLSSSRRTLAKRTVYLGELSPGIYELRFVPSWSGAGKKAPSEVSVQMVSDVFLGWHMVAAAALLWVLPAVLAVLYMRFETQRWNESDFSE